MVTPLQRKLLDELRRKQTQEDARRTPAERVAETDSLRAECEEAFPEAYARPGCDEPPEVWLQMIFRLRERAARAHDAK